MEGNSGVSPGARVILGSVVSFCDDPSRAGNRRAVRYYRRGAVAIGESGRVAWRGHASRLPRAYLGLPVDDYEGALVLPGFIDAHIHFPQHRMLAAPGSDLLDWLDRFTFPEESRYASKAHARAAADAFLDRLAQHGTTAAVVFSSVHRSATEALFAASDRRRHFIVCGKSMMDRNAPASLRDDPVSSARDTEALIERWHGRSRSRYAITVRFAVTSTDEQLRVAGALAARYSDCYVQGHLAETSEETTLVKQLFPWASDHTDIYDRFGLLGPRSLYAHGIHLSERECTRLSATGTTIVHCPTSNTFLGSGLFDAARLGRRDRPVPIAIATDVAGGTSYSMLQTLAEAYKIAKLRGHVFTAHDLFHLATRGNALRLGLADEIGTLDPGRWADIVVLNPSATPVLEARRALSGNLEDTLFTLMLLGDDRAVRATYLAGRQVWGTVPAARHGPS
ncbi:MAG: guanine deaminase [Rhodospirillales bacterium]|nr:guanine deaminase [Rhodospirillales bacterium]